jgi:hypothetical protein
LLRIFIAYLPLITTTPWRGHALHGRDDSDKNHQMRIIIKLTMTVKKAGKSGKLMPKIGHQKQYLPII